MRRGKVPCRCENRVHLLQNLWKQGPCCYYREDCDWDRPGIQNGLLDDPIRGKCAGGVSALIAALKGCSSGRDLEIGKLIHHRVLGAASINTYVANSLLDVYSKCGSLVDARAVFERLPCRSTVSWNILLLGYADNGEEQSSLDLFSSMESEAEPDSRSYMAVFKACSSLASKENGVRLSGGELVKLNALDRGMALHFKAEQGGFCSDISYTFVCNTLVDMYRKCGSMLDARRVFDKMAKRDVVSWNALILGYVENGDEELAFQLFSIMQQQQQYSDSESKEEEQQDQEAPNALTFVAAFKACAGLAAKEPGQQIDGKIVKVESLSRTTTLHAQSSRFFFTSASSKLTGSVMDAYAKCGSMVAAQRVFDAAMPHEDVVLWNVLIMGYAENKECELALKLFHSMNCAADSRTFVAALRALSGLAAQEEAKQISDKRLVKMNCLEKAMDLHSRAAQGGHDGDIFVSSILVDVYAKCGSLQDARGVFDRMSFRNSVSWNALIQGYVENKQVELALELFMAMEPSSWKDAITFVAALKACIGLAAKEEDLRAHGKVVVEKTKQSLETGKKIHRQAADQGWECSMFVATTLVDMYAKCGSLPDARKVFETLPCHEVIAKTALMLGYADKGEAEAALELFSSISTDRLDAGAYAAAIKACSSSAALHSGRLILAGVCKTEFLDTDSALPASVVDLYAKCGCMEQAQLAFDSFRNDEKDPVAATALIAGYGSAGEIERVFRCFREMEEQGLAANAITFVTVLTACSHAGLVEEGRRYFESMRPRYGVEPGAQHYSCVVDMLARANLMDEAVAMVERMPFGASEVVWTSILSACCVWKNLGVAKVAFEALLKFQGCSNSCYTLMANVYGSRGLWSEQAEMLQMAARNS